MSVGAFMTQDGVRVPAITTDQMREVDRVAIEEVGPNLYQMMENAGRNLALTVLDNLGTGWATVPIVVLSGTGGNGGGGICAARHLANRGANVTLVISNPERLTPVPGEQLRVYRGTDGAMGSVTDLAGREAGLIVDAMIGYSLGGAPRGAVGTMVDWATGHPSPVIALDVPSGIDSTTGEAPGPHVVAAVTLTLALPKSGLDATAVGDLQLADIGIPAEVYRRIGVEVPPGLFGDRYRIELRPV